jgi:hypothetical protein
MRPRGPSMIDLARRPPAMWAGVAVALGCIATLSGQSRPLPAKDAFLANLRPRLQSDRALLSQYTYLQREREIHVTKLGKVELGKEKLFQVYPGLSSAESYRRLIAVDGKPRDAKELAADDLKHQKHVLEGLDKREREKRLRKAAEDKREETERVDDLFRVFEIRLVERQTVDGRSMIVVDFSPRADASPKTDVGGMLKKIKGRAWISEDDYEVARVQAEMLEDISIGLFLGKLYKGTTASFERRKVNNEIWLPAEMRFSGIGRALIRKFRIDTVVQYSDYRKFSVDTDTTFNTPQP